MIEVYMICKFPEFIIYSKGVQWRLSIRDLGEFIVFDGKISKED